MIQKSIIFCLILLIGSLPVTATITNIYATDDTYVENYNSPETPKGGLTYINTIDGGSSVLSYGLFHFSLSTIPSGEIIDSATFYGYIYDCQYDCATMQSILPMRKITSSWVASTVKWSTRPSFDSQPFNFITPVTIGYHGAYITSLVQGWYGGSIANYGLLIGGDYTGDNSRVSFYSIEQGGTTKPYISVSHHTPTAPTTPTATAHADYGLSGTTSVAWTASSGDSPITYNIKVGTSSGGSDVLSVTGDAGSSPTFNMVAPATYYWSVQAVNPYGSSAWSTEDSFAYSIPAYSPGALNVRAFEEKPWNTKISNFEVVVYNSTFSLTKQTTTNWTNFTSSEVGAGQYFISISSGTAFAPRSMIVTSPGNSTAYLPATTNTIDFVSFMFTDYTGKFPWSTSQLQIIKNNTIINSASFDADAKVAAYLIRGESYIIRVIHNNDMYEWGKYSSTSSQSVNIIAIDTGVNTTKLNPFTFSVTSPSNASILLSWQDNYSALSNISYTIYQGSTLVYSLNSSQSSGTSDYPIPNGTAMYTVYFVANMVNGQQNRYSTVFDYRLTGARTNEGRVGTAWSYGTFTVPLWIKNMLGIFTLFLLAGSFGALHRLEGGIILGAFSVLFWWWGILTISTAAASLMGGLLFFAVLYMMRSKASTGYQ